MFMLKKLLASLSGPATLGRRVVRAGTWSMAELGLSHALRLMSNLVMTRLLLPEAFGLMAMVTTLHVGLVLLTDLSIHRSIVQAAKGETQQFLRVTWAVQILRGSALSALVVSASALLWLLAPRFAPEGTVYSDPMLPGLIALSALSLIMKGLESTNQWLAVRRMHLGRLATLNISSQIVTLLAMLILVQIETTVWALLWGTLVGAAFRLVLSHLIFDGPKMALEWDKEIADELWNFGKWLLGSSAFTFLAKHVDRLILGALLDKEHFGIYVIALMWVQAVAIVVQKLSDQIGFSVFSEVTRLRPEKIAKVFRKFSIVLDGLCISGFLLVLLGGNYLITLIYPPSYAMAGVFMPLLALGILSARFHVFGMLVLSQGHSKTMLSASALRAITICVALPIGFNVLGIGGALLATALSPISAAPLLMLRSTPVLGRQIRIDIAWFFAIFLIAALVYAIYAPH